jgi:hypothetical protein
MTGYDFHPAAETDLDEIWEYVAAWRYAKSVFRFGGCPASAGRQWVVQESPP